MSTATATKATHQIVDFGPGVDNRDETLGYPVEGSEAECAKYTEELNANYPNVRTNGKDRFCIQEIPADDDANEPQPATPLERLRYHVTGAIERGESEAIVEQPATAEGGSERCKNCGGTFGDGEGILGMAENGEFESYDFACALKLGLEGDLDGNIVKAAQPTTPHTATPSKRPWVWNTYQKVGAKHPITGEPIRDSGFYITSPPGFDIAQLPITSSMNGETQGANVRLIVTAVNAHTALVEALAQIVKIYDTTGGYILDNEIDGARAALALAGQ